METTTGLTFADKGEETGFCAFFNSLNKNKPKDLIRFFERKNGPNYYHTAHGEDALLIANDYYHTTDAITYLGAEGPDGRGGIPSQAISPSLFVDIVRDLLVNKRNRIEVWAVPTGGPKNTQNNWQIIKRASPGNIHDFEDLMFQDDVGAAGADNPITLALQFGFKDGQRMVGAAFIDLNTRTINVCEFIDDDHLSNVESLVVQVGATECLLVQEDEAETTRILTVLEACNVLDTPKRKGEFAIHTLEQDLTTLLALPPLQHNYDEMQKQFAMGAAACLIRHFELLSDSNNINKWHLKSHNFGQYMRLDRTAFVTLHLIPEGKEKRSMSLFSLLNHCRTPMGSRRLVQWIKQPLSSLEQIVERQNIVELFFNDHELRSTLQENLLKRVPDVNRLMRKIVKGNAGLQDILRLYQFVEKLVGIHMALSFYAGEHKDLITAKYEEPLAELIESFKQFEAMVETMVDLSLIDQHEYRIRPDFDDDLKEFYKGLQKSKQKMEDLRSRIADDLELDSKELKLESSKHVGYYFRLTARNEKLIRNRKDFIRVEGQKKDGVKFRNSDLHRLNEDYKKFNRSYEQKQAQIVASVVTTTSTYQQPMERASEIIADLDAFVSMAHVSANWRYTRPQLTEPGVGDIIIKGSRHPCLETMDQINFIANDVNLTREESRVQVITGPNMGGKSTYIRQVAMVVLMAQMGCFVPAESASISIVDAILVRVGAGDSQLRGISTFMAEMLETAAILRSATSKSLICIDELGRGTSTYDGFGLAWAISQHIAKEIKAFCLFATHFHELTSLADEIPHVANLHVTAQTGDEDKLADLTFLYQIRPGACDQSFGIHVAKMTNFPEEIVKVAEAKAAELESFDTVLVKEHQLSPSKRLANKGKQKADEASSPAAQDQSSDADELAGVAERLLQGMEVAGLDQLPRAEAMEKVAALVARIDQAKANNPRLAALLANAH